MTRAGNIAVIPVLGSISQRSAGGMWGMIFGGTTTESLSLAFRQMLADETVGTIVFDIDSPGGTVGGVQEVTDEIFRARGQKRLIAVANSLAASAAYWIATAADEVVVTPSGQVGSIGVFSVHEDWSGFNEMAGIDVTYIAAGKYKVEGNWDSPLTDEARAAIQGRVDEYYDSFVASVARNRGVTPKAVRSGFGEGRVVGAKEAVSLGMADRVGSLRDVLAKLGAGAQRGGMAAEAEPAEPVAEDEPEPVVAIDPNVEIEIRKRRLALR